MEAFKSFKRNAVPIILESKQRDYYNHVSPLILGAFRDPKIGNIIPKLAISSPNVDEVWGLLSYAQIGSPKALKSMVKEISAIREGEKEPARDIKITQRWPVKNKVGYTYAGNFVKLNKDTLELVENGQTKNIPIGNIADSAIAYAKRLTALEEAKKAEALKPKEEDWISSKGKAIRATFISLSGDKITLKLTNGKLSTFALSLLSEESIEKAEGYAE